MFSGSVFDLTPNTEYEIRLSLRDPDGVDGEARRILTAHTRAEPQPAADGKVYHVYPVGFEGPKQEPSFTGLMAAYYMAAPTSTTRTRTRPACSPATRSSCTRACISAIGTTT